MKRHVSMKELAQHVSHESGMPEKDVLRAMDFIFDAIKKQAMAGGIVTIPGLCVIEKVEFLDCSALPIE